MIRRVLLAATATVALTLTGMATAQAAPVTHATATQGISTTGIAPAIGFCGPEKCWT
jgi:hypothetical protein